MSNGTDSPSGNGDGPRRLSLLASAISSRTSVVSWRLHPLADHRRRPPIDRLGLTLDAAPGFCLVVSYNPGYQSVLEELKDSTRQRMVAIEFGFPPADVEEKIVAHEAGIDDDGAAKLVRLGRAIRRLETSGLREVASTRVLIAAGRLIAEGLSPGEAARAAVAGPLADDPTVTRGLVEMIDAYLADQPA
jgi:nitric oxide reductase NorQ protein